MTGLDEAVFAIRKLGRSTVLIDGPGGSGKSYFARRLTDRLPSATIVHVDDFYRTRAERTRDTAQSPWSALDLPRLRREVIEPWKRGEDSFYQKYDWEVAGALLVGSDTLIVEGVFSLNPELASLADYTIWVTCPRDIRLARGIARDGEHMRHTWVDVWMPLEDDYFATFRPDLVADLIVQGTEAWD